MILVGIILCINITESVYVSFKVDKIARASYESFGKTNTFQEDISDLNFLRMNYRGSYYKDYERTYKKNWRLFPITLAFFNHAQSRYWYEYDSNCGGAKTDLYFPVIVSLELKNFRWVITDVRDLP